MKHTMQKAAFFIMALPLMLAFSGCKSKRAEIRNPVEVEISEAQDESRPGEKSEEKDEPKKEYGGLYSDADLDRILKQGKRDIDPVAYYYAGNRCADKEEYQEAAKLYAMAAEKFESWLFKYSKIRWDDEWKESYPGTLDENGECKEFYYSIYNLSCCMSLLELLELSEAYLYNAIIAGYPHLNHLLSDPDLANLYVGPRGDEVKERAKELFACGNDADFFAGKELGIVDGNDVGFFHFNSNGKDAFFYRDPHFSSDSDEPFCIHGTYTVKNFHVLIHFDSIWEKEPLGNHLWTGGLSDRYDAYTLPVLKERNYLWMLSYVDAFDNRWYTWDAWGIRPKHLVRGTFLESILDKPDDRNCFLHLSVIDPFDEILANRRDVEWHPEDDEKNREQNRLNEERRKKQAATALIELSKEEIDANAERRLARYREFADPIIQDYKEKGKTVTFDAEMFDDYKKDAQPETEFCYVVIKGMLKNSAAFTSIYKSTESLFPAGCFLDFTDCTFVESRKLKEDDCNSPDWFTFAVYEKKSSYVSDRDDEPPKAVGIKGIIFPKNLPADISIYYESSSVEIMEFQDSAFPQDIYFGYYKSDKNNSLKAVRLPEGLMAIDNFAFMNCTALEQVYAPKSLKRIERYAFDGGNIPAFEIPENVRYVEEYVFEPCTQLYIPAYRHHPENFDWYDHCFAHTGDNIHWGSCME